VLVEIATIPVDIEDPAALDGRSEPLRRLAMFERDSACSPPLSLRRVSSIDHPPAGEFAMHANALFYNDHVRGRRYFLTNETRSVIDWGRRSLEYAVTIDGGVPDGYLTQILLTQLRLLVSFAVLEKGGIPLHSSCVYKDVRAVVFFGPPGIGKTTIAGLMARGGWLLMNDELNAVMPDCGSMRAYATPFSKRPPELLHNPGGVGLAAAFSLGWGGNRTEEMPEERRFRAVVGSIYAYPDFTDPGKKILENAAAFCSIVPPRLLYFENNETVVALIEKSLPKGK
jgi:hypothetical protein